MTVDDFMAISSLRPNCIMAETDGVITEYTHDQPMPSQAEIDAERERLQALYDAGEDPFADLGVE